MSSDYVPAAFGEVLTEFSQAREILLEALTHAAGIGDHNTVAQLTVRLKRADTLKNEVERLREEWKSVFHPEPEAIETELFALSPLDGQAASGVPDQYDLCSPTLEALRKLGGRGRIKDIVETVIDQMNFADETTRQLHEGGPQTELEWQLGWARTILKTCGMLDNPQSGLWVLTEVGLSQHWMDASEIKVLYRQHLNQRRQRDQV